MRRFLIPTLALAAVLTFTACGSDDPAAVDTGTGGETADDQLVHPDAPIGGEDPDSNPAGDPAGGIRPADGEVAPVEGAVVGRVLGVDRDGPSVEIVESNIVTGADATDAARAAGEIGPDEEWELDFYVMEGATRWIDIDPAASIAVYDCTQACEHVEGTLEHVLAGPPYGGADALWTFVVEDGRATSVEEVYLP